MGDGAGKQKIAILGGGIAALTTAFELTNAEDWQDRYEITVYQMGWRLGGKCATGRGPNGRIEEHGIHAFSGSYYNALGMMWECYKALPQAAKSGVLKSFDEAFLPSNGVFMWEVRKGKLLSWPFSMAPNKMSARRYETSILDVQQVLKSAIELFGKRFNRRMVRLKRRRRESFVGGIRHWFADLRAWIDFIGLLGRTGILSSMLLTVLGVLFPRSPDPLRNDLAHLSFGDYFHRLGVLNNYIATLCRGLFDPDDNILENGFDVIDDQNFDCWLKKHGATQATIDSPLVFNTIDLSYNYPSGDVSRRPRMGAGTYLRWTLRMFLNLGNFAWSFEAGTGETVIAPLYHVLKHRGVRFEFFHKVKALRPSDDGKRIDSVEIDIQAHLKDPAAGYDPLIPVEGRHGTLDCWPNCPKYDLLVEGQELKDREIDLESYWSPWQAPDPAPERRTLRAGDDYHKLVFAISIGAAPYLCADLIERDERWRRMVDHIPTCPTQTMQIWLDKSSAKTVTPALMQGSEEQGNKKGSIISGTFVQPFNGNVDFSGLIKHEAWGHGGPQSLWYFTGAMDQYEGSDFSNHDFPKQQHERVKHQSIQFLQAAAGYLLGGAGNAWDPLGLDFKQLHARSDAQGVERFAEQFWRANIDPTERYVLAPPNSTKHRLTTDGSGFDNLFLAGDWIYNGLNLGSVEGTVMSGRLASNALCGSPPLSAIVGYRARGSGPHG